MFVNNNKVNSLSFNSLNHFWGFFIAFNTKDIETNHFCHLFAFDVVVFVVITYSSLFLFFSFFSLIFFEFFFFKFFNFFFDIELFFFVLKDFSWVQTFVWRLRAWICWLSYSFQDFFDVSYHWCDPNDRIFDNTVANIVIETSGLWSGRRFRNDNSFA